MHKQQILIWTGRYTITDYRHTKLFKEFFFITGDFDMTIICEVTCFLEW